MNIDLKTILKEIEPYKDKVFFYGLKEEEIIIIEKSLKSKFPSFFRDFLKTFGVRQDFVFGLIDTENGFAETSEFLPDEIKNSFILIGDNGGEDFWLLNAKDENDLQIYEWEHWNTGSIRKKKFDFTQLLKDSFTNLTKEYPSRAKNSDKSWHVEFAIETDNEELIYKTIPLKRISFWSLKEISPANVFCYEAKAELNSGEINFVRLEYEGWENPLYSFKYQEPAGSFGNNSLIKEIDAKLKKRFDTYGGMGDWGIISLKEDNSDATMNGLDN